MSTGVSDLTLREAREQAGLSQSALAKKVNLRVETISRIENGFSTKESTFSKICKALNVDPASISGIKIQNYAYRLPRRK